MSADVSDFLQESYGDVRDYAVAGADAPTRAGLLNAFLQALLTLATAPNAPATEQAARSYLSAAYGPLANASWAWTSSYGWTEVDSAVMADFISAQTYAMREASDDPRVGFAWNPLELRGALAERLQDRRRGHPRPARRLDPRDRRRRPRAGVRGDRLLGGGPGRRRR